MATYSVKGTDYEFPDSFDDAKVHQILSAHGVLPPPGPSAGKPPAIPALQGKPESQAGEYAHSVALNAIPSALGVARSAFPPAVALDGAQQAVDSFNGKPGPSIGQMGSNLVRPYVHPIDSFREDPVGTALAWSPALRAPKAIRMGMDAMPSMERAGRNFEGVMAKAGDVPVNVSSFTKPVMRAQELNANTGAPVPAVLQKGFEAIQPTTNPMTYRQSRDLASAAGRLSAQDSMAASPQMKAQISHFAKIGDVANREAADSVGMAPQYDSAMTEYRRAAAIRDFKDTAKGALKNKAVQMGLGVMGGAAAYPVVKKLLGD